MTGGPSVLGQALAVGLAAVLAAGLVAIASGAFLLVGVRARPRVLLVGWLWIIVGIYGGALLAVLAPTV